MWKRKLEIAVDDDHFEPLLKVAFATHDRQSVDQHFGQARTFLIYEINQNESRLVNALEFSLNETAHQHLTERVSALSDCHAVFCNACGASALKQLLANKTYPVRVDAGLAIKQCLVKIQFEIDNPSEGWLQRAVAEAKAQKFDREAYLDSLLDEPW